MQKSGLSEHEFEIRKAEIESSIKFVKESEYESFLKKTKDSLSDLDDIDFLALALSINSSIWSNDPHLKEQPLVSVFTTAELISMFFKGEV